MSKKQYNADIYTRLDEDYHKYLISIDKFSTDPRSTNIYNEFKDITNESEEWIEHSVIVRIDIDSIFRDKLKYINATIEENLDRLIRFNVVSLKKHSLFAIEDGYLSLIFKNTQKAVSFFNRIKNFESERFKIIKTLEYYKEFHFNKFLSKALLSKDLENVDYDSLKATLDKFIVNDPSSLTHENINLSALCVDKSMVEKHTLDLMFDKIDNEFKQIRYFNKHLHFKNNKFFFKYLEEPGMNASALLKNFFNYHWHKLGDSEFLYKIEQQVQKYNFTGFFSTSDFVANNAKFFLNFDKELRNTIYSHFDNMSVLDVIERNNTLRLELEQYNVFKNSVLSDDRLIEESIAFSDLSQKHSFITKQRAFCSSVEEKLKELNINNLNDFLNLRVEDFIREMDNSNNKSHYNNFLEFDYVAITIGEFLEDFSNNELSFISQGSNYLNILNSYGGFFLILFDLINISKGNTIGFDIYTSFFSKAKYSDPLYQKRAIFLIFLISSTLFSNEFEVDRDYFINLFLSNKEIFENSILNGEVSEERIESLRNFYDDVCLHQDYFKNIQKLSSILLTQNF